MKLLQFLRYIVQHGTLYLQPVDFEEERRKVLAVTGIAIPKEIGGKSKGRSSFLMRHPLAYMLGANLSFLKNAFRMNNMYYISDRYRLIYVRVLKCASTSMLKAFLPLLDDKLRDKDLSLEVVDALGVYFRHRVLQKSQISYAKFGLVRSPFQRLVSTYLDLFDPGAQNFTYASYCFGILRPDMSFSEFVAVLGKIPTMLLGPHFSPQSYILGVPAKKDIIIFRIDKDMTSLISFLKQHGMSLSQANNYPVEYDYRSYYDQNTFAQVRDLYRDDIAAFGYEEESVLLAEYVNAL